MATITEMADATKPSPSVNSPATHQRPVAEAEVAPKPHTVAKPPSSDLRGRPADRLSNVVERTADMSVELLKSLETGELAASDAVGTFAISIEDGLTEQVNSTSAVAKTFVIAIEGEPERAGHRHFRCGEEARGRYPRRPDRAGHQHLRCGEETRDRDGGRRHRRDHSDDHGREEDHGLWL